MSAPGVAPFQSKSTTTPKTNQFSYVQVRSPYGSGHFARELRRDLNDAENLVVSEIAGRDQIYDAIKDFLGKGR